MKKTIMTKEQKEHIFLLYKQGQSFRKIEKLLHINRHVVSNFIKNNVDTIIQLNTNTDKLSLISTNPEDINIESKDLTEFYFQQLSYIPHNTDKLVIESIQSNEAFSKVTSDDSSNESNIDSSDHLRNDDRNENKSDHSKVENDTKNDIVAIMDQVNSISQKNNNDFFCDETTHNPVYDKVLYQMKKLLYNGHYYGEIKAGILHFVYNPHLDECVDKVQLLSSFRKKFPSFNSDQISTLIKLELKTNLRENISLLSTKYLDTYRDDIKYIEEFIFNEKKNQTVAYILRQYIINLSSVTNFSFSNIPKYMRVLYTVKNFLRLDNGLLEQIIVTSAKQNVCLTDVYDSIVSVCNSFKTIVYN